MMLILVLGVSSCVKDVDLDQAGDISLKPKIQADLLIFDVEPKDFIDGSSGQFKNTIRDTVRLEFLDDDYIQKDLEEVEFSFRYSNTFPREFSSKISFLSENNRVQHNVDFIINAGSPGNPAITEHIEFIGNDRIEVIKRSIKMVVELELLPGDQEFEGDLSFASKGLFSFEF
ncbi:MULTISPECIES: hypothetical protein [Antarcticibacterium]|nr:MULTISPECIES: hypothetical protein [Antarcticibacterium]